MRSGRAHERGLPLGVERAGSPDVPREVPAVDEVGEGRLGHRRRVPVGQARAATNASTSSGGHDQVPEAERRKSTLLKVPA